MFQTAASLKRRWFFDIYIQGSKCSYDKELSLESVINNRISVITNFPRL